MPQEAAKTPPPAAPLLKGSARRKHQPQYLRWAGPLVALGLGLLWLIVEGIGALDQIEQYTVDLRYQARGELPSPKKLVYVNFDQKTIGALGQSPWDRRVFADVASGVLDYGNAKAIFYDFVFSPATASQMVRPESQRESDLAMATMASQRGGQMILGTAYTGVMLPSMSRQSLLPLKRKGNYDPATNAMPEAPNMPIWLPALPNMGLPGWGRVGLINFDLEKSAGAIVRWAPLFVELQNDELAKHFASGLARMSGYGNPPELDLNPSLPNYAWDPSRITEYPDRYEVVTQSWENPGSPVEVIPRYQPVTFYAVAVELMLAYHGLPSIPGLTVVHEDKYLLLKDLGGTELYRIPLVQGQLLEINWFSKWRSDQIAETSVLDVLNRREKLILARLSLEASGGEGAAADQARAEIGEHEAYFERFRDALVLCGPTDPILQDVAPTPFDTDLVPRVGAHGNLVKTIASGRYLHRLPDWATPAIVVLLALLATLPIVMPGRLLPPAFEFLWTVLAAGALVLYLILAFVLFATVDLVLPVASPTAGAVTSAIAAFGLSLYAAQRQRSQIEAQFGSFLDPTLVKRMAETGEMPELGGVETEITAFFSDIEGFSGFSEQLTPPQLVVLMNEFLDPLTNILLHEGGALDKYIGDAIVAMFNAPVTVQHHAYRACVSSLLMQQKLADLRAKWQAEGDRWPKKVWNMRCRIGLNTGPAVVGNMGSQRRKNFTMMGDTVNLAARCESAAKQYGVYIMVTGETRQAAMADYEKLRAAHPSPEAAAEAGVRQLAFRFLDRVVVKGRSKPADFFEVVGFVDELSDDQKKCLETYQEAVECYWAREWDEAMALAQRSAELELHRPNPLSAHAKDAPTNPSLVLMQRIAYYRENPPPPDWDGRTVLKDK